MELAAEPEPIRDNKHQNKKLPDNITQQGIYANVDTKTPMNQPGFLRCVLAILTVLCITLGVSMVTLHVYRQTSIGSQVKELKTELEQLKMKGGAKIAFSASLWETGEQRFDVAPILAYKRIFTNIGNAYDSNTGNFIAPVKGVYFFCFNAFGYSGSVSGAILTKNGQLMVSTYELASSGDASDTTGNSVILQLEAGESVSMRLWQNASVFDHRNGLNTFSGFLLFAL
ncbi:complement C1q-like protein 2 isoform X1 [Sardina pilchardus]|uniref:complement C1q-like protein 2 isoform X1 n=1 Tax=Sardina pilchardus TaxID=27697 RepID=UPI002E15BCB5